MQGAPEGQEFWMVWSPEGRAPTVKHVSQESADREAARLSRANPDSTFYVLQALHGFRDRLAKQIEIMRPDDIPF